MHMKNKAIGVPTYVISCNVKEKVPIGSFSFVLTKVNSKNI